MKGMNTTLSLNESDNQQADTLESIFRYSCTKNGVPESAKDSLIENGISLFEISSNGNVFPLNADFPTIASYVIKHRGDIVQANDNSNLTKEQLYNRLANAASSHNMREYRRLRTLYSAVV